MAALTTFARNSLLDLTLSGTAYSAPAAVYLALFTTPPSADGTGTEITGGGYTRQAVTFDSATDGVIASDADVTWSPLHTDAAQVLAGWALFDDPTAGNMLVYHTFTSTRAVRANKELTFAAGDLTITSARTNMSDYLADAWLDHITGTASYTAPADVYLAHYTTLPTASTAGTEPTGDSAYVRSSVTFAAADAGAATTNLGVMWTPLVADAGATFLGWALADDVTGGNVLFFGAWTSSLAVAANDDVEVASGTITVAVL